jgi:hypothetical protein
MILNKIQPLSLGLALALLASSSPSRAADDSELFRTGFSYPNTSPGKEYELVVRQSHIDAAPNWPDDQLNPPLAPRKAISLATEWVHKFFPESTNPPVSQLDMKSVGHKGQWIYVALFELRSQPGWTPTVAFPVVVLMNGHVVEPTIVPDGESKSFGSFSLRKVPVIQVLMMYREYAGGPLAAADLKTSKDVPLNAEVSIESQSATRTEALRIFEKALREQAGVVVTPSGTNHFSITYDPTVKTGKAK